ncbi:hypothetical protein Tco_0619508 [Tanacetum coccineum]
MEHEVCNFFKFSDLPEWWYSWIFQRGRGLRQWYLISPYIFTLVMEVLNLIMMKNIDESDDFGYHFGCKELKLSHICFANDLLVLCKGNKESLMNAGESVKGKAKVDWKVVYRPKEQGGLGIKPLKKWNEILLVNAQVDSNDSWGWKKMMFIRDKVKEHVVYEIGKGNTISMWHDKRNSYGPIGNFITQRSIYDARFLINITHAEMIRFPNLQNIFVLNINNDKDDRVLWVTNAGQKVLFSTKQAWLDDDIK